MHIGMFWSVWDVDKSPKSSSLVLLMSCFFAPSACDVSHARGSRDMTLSVDFFSILILVNFKVLDSSQWRFVTVRDGFGRIVMASAMPQCLFSRMNLVVFPWASDAAARNAQLVWKMLVLVGNDKAFTLRKNTCCASLLLALAAFLIHVSHVYCIIL